MTAKRFTYDKPLVAFSKGGINDNVTGETYEFTMDTVLDLLNELHEENQALQRHIKRSTFNKIRVEDVFNCAKYDKFYDNEEAIKSIDWIAKELGVDFE